MTAFRIVDVHGPDAALETDAARARWSDLLDGCSREGAVIARLCKDAHLTSPTLAGSPPYGIEERRLFERSKCDRSDLKSRRGFGSDALSFALSPTYKISKT